MPSGTIPVDVKIGSSVKRPNFPLLSFATTARTEVPDETAVVPIVEFLSKM